MINIKTLLSIFLVTCFAIFSTSARAAVVFLDLNDFLLVDPTVTVAADGASATLLEDGFFPSARLGNDPFFGDPDIIDPSNSALLKFEYNFTEGAANDDEFIANVLDDFGFSVLNFTIGTTSSGTVSFDIGQFFGNFPFMGMQFELFSFDQSLTSSVSVSNLRIETIDVPLPPVTGLMFLGFIWLNIIRRRRMVN